MYLNLPEEPPSWAAVELAGGSAEEDAAGCLPSFGARCAGAGRVVHPAQADAASDLGVALAVALGDAANEHA
jgi:hypothetical protein